MLAEDVIRLEATLKQEGFIPGTPFGVNENSLGPHGGL
jgi:hypothetical protein